MTEIDGLDDRGLINGFRESGEMRYLDALVRRHIAKVRSMVYPIVLNEADADDVTQEVFVRVARGIERFRGDAKFSSWLHRIAVNASMDCLRKRARRCEDDGHLVPDLPDGRPGPDRRACARELGDDIHEALQSLSPRLRAAVTATVIEGLSTRDAAKACGCLPATLSWRVHHARKQLRQMLDHPGDRA